MLGWALRVVVVCVVISVAVGIALISYEPLWRLPIRGSGATAAVQPAPRRVASNELVYRRAPNGHFYVDAEVDGGRVHFLVDTGASDVVLTPNDARAAGLSLQELDFSNRIETANGEAHVAGATLRRMSLSQLEVFDLPVLVIDHDMPASLLGMNFLRRLDGYEIRDNELILRW